MTKFIMTNPVFREFDADGLPLAGGYAYFYAAGTDTPKDVYQDAAGVAAHPNPVILDSRGEAVIYGNGAYKVITKTPSGTTVRTVDNYKILNISPFAETLLDDDDAASIRATLELGSAALLDAGTNPNNVVQLDANNPARLPAVDGRALDLTHMPDANFPVSVFAFPRSYLAGFTLSNSTSGETPDADHDIDIAAGECRDSTHTANIVLASSMTKQLDASWAPGNFAGGLDGGEVQADTWYHVFVIKNPTSGAVDVLFSTSASSPTLPDGFTKFRRIGSVRTYDDSGEVKIIKFIQYADEFYWDLPLMINKQTVEATQETITVPWVPPGFSVLAYMCFGFSMGSDLVFSAYSADLADQMGGDIHLSDSTGSASDKLMDTYWRIDPATASRHIMPKAHSLYGDNVGADGRWNTLRELLVRTNSSAQIKISGLTAGIQIRIQVNGWIDRRGRDD